MGALDMLPVWAILSVVWLKAMYLILGPSPAPTPPLLELPPECLQLIDELTSSLSLSADLLRQRESLLSSLKRQTEDLDRILKHQRQLIQDILVEKQKISMVLKQLLARLKSRASTVGEVAADVKLRLDSTGPAVESDLTASRRLRRNSF